MRRLSPLPLLGHLRVGLFDQGAKPGEGLAPPVAQLFDPCVYQLSWRLDLLRGALLHVVDVPLLCFYVVPFYLTTLQAAPPSRQRDRRQDLRGPRQKQDAALC